MKAVCEALGVSRSNIAASFKAALAKPLKRVGRPAKPDDELVREIQTIIGEQPTYGYRRVWALLKREVVRSGRGPVNAKRVYRAMKAHGLLLQRHVGGVDQRRHDGKIALERSNLRWCSDGFELACDNGEKVRIAFALDCCDREAMAYVATTQGIKGEDVRDLMVASVESRFGRVNRAPQTIEWLSDNGSAYIAKETRAFARDIGLEPLTTPFTSPQSNGMAEAFVQTIKRDYARVNPLPDARTVIESLPAWFDHNNVVHPHSALSYGSPREFIAAQSNQEAVSGI
jgi:putative transposase